MGQDIDDKTILASVKTKLVADKPSNLTRVNVDVTNGNVDSAEQKIRAERLAHDVRGVKSVVNNLQVNATEPGARECPSPRRGGAASEASRGEGAVAPDTHPCSAPQGEGVRHDVHA